MKKKHMYTIIRRLCKLSRVGRPRIIRYSRVDCRLSQSETNHGALRRVLNFIQKHRITNSPHEKHTQLLPAPEPVIGVEDGAVVGADHLPGADRMVVVDPFVPAGAPTCMPEQERGAVVHGSKEFGEGLVRDEPLGRHRALK